MSERDADKATRSHALAVRALAEFLKYAAEEADELGLEFLAYLAGMAATEASSIAESSTRTEPISRDAS